MTYDEILDKLRATDWDMCHEVPSVASNNAADALLYIEEQARLIRKLEQEVTSRDEYLKFIERWAVYKTGPAEERLSVIAFYPPIRAITRSYTGEPGPVSEEEMGLMKKIAKEAQ